MLRYIDLILFDIKHLDSDRHQKTTGIKNNILLENLRKAAGTNNIWLRVPLIAGFNDSEKHIKNIVVLGKEIHAQKISILPYHEGGKSKCVQLGTFYSFPDGKTPDEKHLQKLKTIIEKAGLSVSIGN